MKQYQIFLITALTPLILIATMVTGAFGVYFDRDNSLALALVYAAAACSVLSVTAGMFGWQKDFIVDVIPVTVHHPPNLYMPPIYRERERRFFPLTGIYMRTLVHVGIQGMMTYLVTYL